MTDQLIVALHVGAWVEMTVKGYRTKASCVALRAGAWVEIERFMRNGLFHYGSHSVWVRGLKSYRGDCTSPSVRSHPRRMRGLKSRMLVIADLLIVVPREGEMDDTLLVRQHCITRMAVTSEEESRKMDGVNMSMGRKSDIPYGLYMCKGFVSANFAFQTGFSTEDSNLFWEALKYMFEDDRSSMRGFMSPRKLIVFCHDSKFGNAYSGELFDLVKVKKTCEGSPRSFADYEITIDKKKLPKGVSIHEII